MRFQLRPRLRPGIPRRLAAGFVALALAGCEADSTLLNPFEDPTPGRSGLVVADEPRAVVAARDVLEAGGNAADAATALYFTLAVTLPSSASLGSGGMCLIFDPEDDTTEALDFMPRATAEGQLAAPASPRGIAALHARYGTITWEELLSGAEQLARFGVPTSRALARELATAGDGVLSDAQMAAVFGPQGTLLDEGQPLQQIELAGVLAQIRQNGIGELYTGPLANSFVQAVNAIGGRLTIESMRATTPEFRAPVSLQAGDHVLKLAPPPAAGGALAGQLIEMLTEVGDYADADPAEQPHLLVEAMKRMFADRARWMQPDGTAVEPIEQVVAPERAAALMQDYAAGAATPLTSLPAVPVARPENPWATGFVVVDGRGLGVACAITMNELFGTGRMVPGTGIILAPAPNERGAGAAALGPIMLVNENTGQLFFAAAASGGTTAPTAIVEVYLGVVAEGGVLTDVVAAKRLHHNGDPDLVFHEPGESQARLDALRQRGHTLEEVPIIGRVNAVWCPEGTPRTAESCQAASDPRADGLSVILAE